jgi:hypothetical protein
MLRGRQAHVEFAAGRLAVGVQLEFDFLEREES